MAVNNNNVTSSAALNALKAACVHKKFASFKDLLPGEYIVNNFSIVDTTFGERVRVELADAYMFLPPCFLRTLKPEVIEDLNKSPKIMVYKGKDADNRNALILDFNEVSYFDGEVFGLLTQKL